MVSNQLNDSNNATIIYTNLNQVNKNIENEIRELTNADIALTSKDLSKSLFSNNLLLVRYARTTMANILSVIMVSFSLIIVGVSLLVIRYKITNSIEEDMIKIGTLRNRLSE